MSRVNIVLLVVCSLFLASCATAKRCSIKFPSVASRDSIRIETVKEVPYYLPGDTINVSVPINCPDQDLVFVENSKLRQDIRILKGKLVSNTTIKPDTIKIPVIETETVVKEVKVPEVIKVIPKFYKYCTFGSIGIVLIVIVYFFLKWKLKILALFKK